MSLVLSLFLIWNVGSVQQQTGRYPSKYNLIDANPSCRYPIPSGVCCLGSLLGATTCVGNYSAQCPLIYNGPGDIDVMAIHPNIKERTDYLMRNMARLFPKFIHHLNGVLVAHI